MLKDLRNYNLIKFIYRLYLVIQPSLFFKCIEDWYRPKYTTRFITLPKTQLKQLNNL